MCILALERMQCAYSDLLRSSTSCVIHSAALKYMTCAYRSNAHLCASWAHCVCILCSAQALWVNLKLCSATMQYMSGLVSSPNVSEGRKIWNNFSFAVNKWSTGNSVLDNLDLQKFCKSLRTQRFESTSWTTCLFCFPALLERRLQKSTTLI